MIHSYTNYNNNILLKSQLLPWQKTEKTSPTLSLTIRANKGLSHYHRCFRYLTINETNHLLYYKQETHSLKACLPLSLLLIIFYNALCHGLSGHPGRGKTHAAITEN